MRLVFRIRLAAVAAAADGFDPPAYFLNVVGIRVRLLLLIRATCIDFFFKVSMRFVFRLRLAAVAAAGGHGSPKHTKNQ